MCVHAAGLKAAQCEASVTTHTHSFRFQGRSRGASAPRRSREMTMTAVHDGIGPQCMTGGEDFSDRPQPHIAAPPSLTYY